jgi:hypothetical protein
MFAHEIELMNVSGTVSDFLSSFLTVCVCVRYCEHDTQNKHRPTTGFFGLTMFNIFVNRIFQCNFKGRLQMYADDVASAILTRFGTVCRVEDVCADE